MIMLFNKSRIILCTKLTIEKKWINSTKEILNLCLCLNCAKMSIIIYNKLKKIKTLIEKRK